LPLESEMLSLKDKYLPFANADQFAAEIIGLVGKCEKVLVEAIFLPMLKASNADRCYANGVRLRLAGPDP